MEVFVHTKYSADVWLLKMSKVGSSSVCNLRKSKYYDFDLFSNLTVRSKNKIVKLLHTINIHSVYSSSVGGKISGHFGFVSV